MAINFNNTTKNKVSFCGIEYLITDEEAIKLKSLLDSMVSSRGLTSTPSTTLHLEEETTTKSYEQKDIKGKFEITKRTSTEGKNLYCVTRLCGWTRAEKNCVNSLIKALPEIREIKVKGTKDDGSEFTFRAWGYTTKKKAEEMIKTLPEVIKADEIKKFAK